jgi:replicative superfamily II helicase
VIADIKRRGEWVGVHEYVQWAGRAARPRFSYDKGYCHVLTDDCDETKQRFFTPHRELEDIQNHVDDKGQFRWLVLELIANGWRSTEQIENFIKKTLYYHQMSSNSGWGQRPESKAEQLSERLKETAEWLTDKGFISASDTRSAFNTTHLGRGAVDFQYNSWIDADLLSIKAFYDWIENTDTGNINQLDYLHQVVTNFDITIGAKDANGQLDPVLRDYGYDIDKEGVTAGIIRWYWMRNCPMEQIEKETEIDPTYIPGTARTLSGTIDASSNIIEAAPDGRIPEWHENLVFRVKKGVQEDATPLVADIEGMGRDRIRNLRSYLKQMARQTLDIDPNHSIWTLLVKFKQHTDTESQFKGILADKVTSIGEVTADNVNEFVQENDLSGDAITTDEEYALGTGAKTSEPDLGKDVSRPTSITDY